VGPATIVPTPVRRWSAPDELAGTVGFVPLAPAYLPPGCEARERYALARPPAAYLIYACVAIAQQAGGIVQQPAVGAGAAEVLAVGGYPALYIRGGWVEARRGTPGGLPGEPGELVWREDVGQTLILERDGLIIRLQVPGAATLSREELLRIAESLRPIE
jgi:hypothetical protein